MTTKNKTDNATAIKSLIKLAGINLQQNPTNQAESLLDGLWKLESEHAALLAVAEAARVLQDGLDLQAGRWPADEKSLKQALAQLAAVREGGAK